MTNNIVAPINVIAAAGLTPQQAKHLCAGQLIELARLVYWNQIQENNKNDRNR